MLPVARRDQCACLDNPSLYETKTGVEMTESYDYVTVRKFSFMIFCGICYDSCRSIRRVTIVIKYPEVLLRVTASVLTI